MRKKDEKSIEVKSLPAKTKYRLWLDKMRLEVYWGDVVVWSWKSATPKAFTIIFAENDTPFLGRAFSADGNKISQKINYKPKKHRAEDRSFKYTIAGYYKGKVLILDPEIIVKRPPRA